MTSFDEARVKRDGSGQFAEKPAAAESGVELGGPQDPGGPGGPDWDGSWPGDEPETSDVITAGPDELDDYVNHPDWRVRADAVANPNLTDVQARVLADPATQPRTVRLAVAQSGLSGAAERASRDPSPTIRAIASTSFPLSASSVERLDADSEVVALRYHLATA